MKGAKRERGNKKSTPTAMASPEAVDTAAAATAVPSTSRRPAYISANHLLSFQVQSSSSPFQASSISPPGRRGHRAAGRSGPSFSKERFIHANFRFVKLQEEEVEANKAKEQGDIHPREDGNNARATFPKKWNHDMEPTIRRRNQNEDGKMQRAFPFKEEGGPITTVRKVHSYAHGMGESMMDQEITLKGNGPEANIQANSYLNGKKDKTHGICGNQDTSLQRNVDVPMPWEAIEMVIVPVAHDATCPICLDTPSIPKLTKCGHYFCWPCILHYAAATRTSSPSFGNWRSCPICFESIDVRQLKSVHFSPVLDYTTSWQGPSPTIISMVLVARSSTWADALPTLGSSEETLRRMEDLSPFRKIIPLPKAFIVDAIIQPEIDTLQGTLRRMDKCDPTRDYVSLALSLAVDRKRAFCGGEGLVRMHSPLHLPQLDDTALYFHQSFDGQPFFLCQLNVKMLRRQFCEYRLFPPLLSVPLVEIEMEVMTEQLRRRYKHLAHLPLGCHFGLCEVDLSQILSASIMEEFAAELQAREAQRKAKARREELVNARAKRREQACLSRSSSSYYYYQHHADVESHACSPGIASGMLESAFLQDYERFPPPPGSEPTTESTPKPIDIGNASSRIKPLAGSFASVAAFPPSLIETGGGSGSFLSTYSMPLDGGRGVTLSTGPAFDLSLEELALAPPPGSPSGGKKGKRLLLVSTTSQRRFS